jgi:hypothetical protein
MTLSANTGRRIGAAESHMLVDRHIVVDFGALADDAETMVKKETLPDPGARMNVDPGQEPGEMVDEASDEKEPPFPEPVGYAMQR